MPKPLWKQILYPALKNDGRTMNYDALRTEDFIAEQSWSENRAWKARHGSRMPVLYILRAENDHGRVEYDMTSPGNLSKSGMDVLEKLFEAHTIGRWWISHGWGYCETRHGHDLFLLRRIAEAVMNPENIAETAQVKGPLQPRGPGLDYDR